ncbi:hypothetical protein EDB86DRAFT_2244808 [Lactarius hatsudake]|nr:hypothetical protein EDB86DRAFT_2244808 [Lactarius hatsudake]
MVSQKKSASRAPKHGPKRSLPLRALFTRLVLMSVSSYALLDMAVMAFIPLVWPTLADLGRLVYNLAHTGLWMSGYGCLDGLIQFTLFPYIVVRLGPRRFFLSCDFVDIFVLVEAEPKGTLEQPSCQRVRGRCSTARCVPSQGGSTSDSFTEKSEKSDNLRTINGDDGDQAGTRRRHNIAGVFRAPRQDQRGVSLASNARYSASSLTRSGLEVTTMHWKRWLEYV